MPDEHLELGDERRDQRSVRPERLVQGCAPSRDVRVRFAEDLAYERLERFGERGVGDVALVLIELAATDPDVLHADRPHQLGDESRLPDPGVARHQDELGGARARPRERRRQLRARLGATVESLRDEHAMGVVVCAQRAYIDPPERADIRKAPLEVVGEPGRGLIAVVDGLREQLQHDGGELRGHTAGKRWHGPRDVAVYPLDLRRRGEREMPGQKLVERDADRIQIAAFVDRTVEAPGLFGRHVRERPGELTGRVGSAAGRVPEAGEPHVPSDEVDEDVCGLDVAMDQVVRVELA